jgi:hypothetical protein
MTFNRRDVIAGLILATVATLSWVPRLRGPIDLRWDGAAYYILGTALAEGKGYRLLSEPGDIQTTLHPPMLPAMIALHRWLLRTNDIVILGHGLRMTYLVLFVCYVVAGFLLLRLFLPTSYSFLAALIFALQLHTIFMSDLCFPEIPFGLATVLFAFCNWRAGRWRLLSAPLAVISYGLRTIGVALLAAWVGESILERRWRQAAIRLLISAIPVLCWMGYVAHVESSDEHKKSFYDYQRADYVFTNVSYAKNMRYKDPFSPEFGYASPQDRVKSFFSNMRRMPVNLGEAVSAKEGIWDLVRSSIEKRVRYALLPERGIRVILFFLSTLIVGGIGLQLAKRQYFVPLYITFSLIIICTTPWPGQFDRYLTPLAPLLSLSLFLAVRSIAERITWRFSLRSGFVNTAAAGGVALLILGSQLPALFALYTKWHQEAEFNASDERLDYRLFFYHGWYPAADAAFDQLKDRVSGTDIVAASDPQWVFLRTGLKSVFPPFELDADKAQRLLDSVPVKFLMVDDSIYRKYTDRVVATHPERWQRVFAEATAEATGVQGKLEVYERVGRP